MLVCVYPVNFITEKYKKELKNGISCPLGEQKNPVSRPGVSKRRPCRDSNPGFWLRRPTLYPLSYRDELDEPNFTTSKTCCLLLNDAVFLVHPGDFVSLRLNQRGALFAIVAPDANGTLLDEADVAAGYSGG